MHKNKSFFSAQNIALILAIVAIISSFSIFFEKPQSSGGISGEESGDGKTTFTATTEEYKDLQKFVKWVDSEGETVSTSPTYRYRATEEMELTAVYEDIDFVIAQGSSTWDSSTHTLTGSKWTDINYLEMPLEKGMSVTVEWTIGGNSDFGLASSEQIANPTDNSWVISSATTLFAPKYNMYFGTDQSSWKYITTTSNPSLEDCSIPFSTDLRGQTVKVKIVLADEIEFYIDDVLVTTSTIDFTYAYNDKYYFSFWGSGGTIKLVEFGWDKDTEQVFSGVALASDYYSGKTITFLGDSITAGVGATDTATERYSTVLSTLLGATENNMGNSGWVICTGGVRSSQLQNISNIPTDSDLVIVMLGTNDQNLANSSQYTLGTDGDTTTTTVWGATETMCRQLAERFEGTNTRIIICTPPYQKGTDSEVAGGHLYSLRDISNVIMTCAKRNGLLYADVNALANLTDDDMNDTLHPNTSGHEKIAQYLAKYILSGYEYYTPYEN
ncbi:MAG: SGNH/GDSL hydrolase family protein [Clostridia bacterium]|nr:SGNH/GDSL hydrolase family protein [Clostridia bacterium]